MPTLKRLNSLVTQDPFLWHGTLRDNLDLEHVRTDEEIWVALDKVGMKEAVEQLDVKEEEGVSEKPSSPSNKLNYVLEDSGSFSRGQVGLL